MKATARTPKRKSRKGIAPSPTVGSEVGESCAQKEEAPCHLAGREGDRSTEAMEEFGFEAEADANVDRHADQINDFEQSPGATEDECVRPGGDHAGRGEQRRVQMVMPDRTTPTNNHDRQASHADRRIMGAAATLGGATGMLLMGPVTGTALCAAAAYATTREDSAGTLARRAGAAYVQATDRAVDKGLQLADRAVDEGLRRICHKLDNVDTSGAPAPLQGPLRSGLRKVSDRLRTDPRASRSFGEDRKEEARRMREQYPDRIPVIVEKSPYCALPEIDKKKFAVPGTMLCGEFKYIVHKHVVEAMGGTLRTEQTIYLFVNGIAPKTSTPMAELYSKFKGDDGFLYVRYGAENTLGGNP